MARSRSRLTPAERDEAFARDIFASTNRLGRWLSSVDREQFDGDDKLQSATLQQLAVIGEAATQLSDAFKRRHSGIPWQSIIGMRNLAVHTYWRVDYDMVWKAATQGAPKLGSYLQTLFVEEA